jgi:hypothetical protein
LPRIITPRARQISFITTSKIKISPFMCMGKGVKGTGTITKYNKNENTTNIIPRTFGRFL